jgi:Holliday junction resolvase RusA-like endonuclease
METYNISPVAKPRMTQRDKWKGRPCVVKYQGFKDEVRNAGIEIGLELDVEFNVQMPPSWSKIKKEQMYDKPHLQKPDLDNFVKAILDAVLSEDCTVWKITATKRWAYEGSISIN